MLHSEFELLTFLDFEMAKVIESIEQQLEHHKKRIAQLTERKKLIDARTKQRDRKQSEIQQTRRKILAGAYLLKCFDSNTQATKHGFEDSLVRDVDRRLFDLDLL